MIGGDPQRIDELARTVRGLQARLADAGAQLRRTDDVHWVSTAADGFRRRLQELAGRTDDCADELGAAARDLGELADRVRERQRAIASAESAVLGWLGAARDQIASLAGVAADQLADAEVLALQRAHDVVRAAAYLPGPGSPEWLVLAAQLGGEHG